MRHMKKLFSVIITSSLIIGCLNSFVSAGVNGQELNKAATPLSSEAAVSDSRIDIQGVEDFVTRMYSLSVGRAPDPEGLQAWMNVILEERGTGISVAYGFIYSREFQKMDVTNEEYVELMYQMFFGRDSDPSGKAGWVSVLESMDKASGRLDVFNGFANSKEFYDICKSYGIVSGTFIPGADIDKVANINLFVQRLYKVILERDCDQSGMTNWTKALLSGSNTGVEAAYGFFFSSEYEARKRTFTQYINDLYNAFMGRSAEGAGLTSWLDVMAYGGTKEHVFNGFAMSTEFAKICSRYGIVQGGPISEEKDTTNTLTIDIEMMTPTPTVSPTSSPSSTPTAAPTSAPTEKPEKRDLTETQKKIYHDILTANKDDIIRFEQSIGERSEKYYTSCALVDINGDGVDELMINVMEPDTYVGELRIYRINPQANPEMVFSEYSYSAYEGGIKIMVYEVGGRTDLFVFRGSSGEDRSYVESYTRYQFDQDCQFSGIEGYDHVILLDDNNNTVNQYYCYDKESDKRTYDLGVAALTRNVSEILFVSMADESAIPDVPVTGLTYGQMEEKLRPSGYVMSDVGMYVFSSGAAGWQEELNINTDGTFTGRYEDFDGLCTEQGYEVCDGVLYYCDYSGKITDIERVDKNIYKMTIGEFETSLPSGQHKVRDNVLNLTVESSNMQALNVLYLYLPGTPLSDMNEVAREHLTMTLNFYSIDLGEIEVTHLPYYVIFNETTGATFIAMGTGEESVG